MSKTSVEICEEALRLIGVLSSDDSAEQTDYLRAKAHMEAIYAHLDEIDDLALTYDVETVPDECFLHFSNAVAGSIAGSYGKAQRAAEIAATINTSLPPQTLMEIGLMGLRQREARTLATENHTVTAEYF